MGHTVWLDFEIESQQQLESDVHSSNGYTNDLSEEFNRESSITTSQSISALSQSLSSSVQSTSTPQNNKIISQPSTSSHSVSTQSEQQHKSNIQDMKQYKRKKK